MAGHPHFGYDGKLSHPSATPMASFGVARPPLFGLRVVRPPPRAKTLFFFFFFFSFHFCPWDGFHPCGPWGWFGHPQGPKPFFILFHFCPWGGQTTSKGHGGGSATPQTSRATPWAKVEKKNEVLAHDLWGWLSTSFFFLLSP